MPIFGQTSSRPPDMIAPNPLFIPLHAALAHDNPASFIFRGNELLLSEDWHLPDVGTCTALALPEALVQPLGSFAGRYCRTVTVSAATLPPAGHEFVKLRAVLAAAGPESVLSLAGRAYQIAEWARTHQFCGVCATKILRVDGERCVKCPACGAMTYPRISPAMMVLITRGDQALLARHTASTSHIFSALAGFVEAGESIEETVHREVMEEVGLKVHKLQYFGSQPWPFPHSLMIAFKAEYLSGEIRLDENEIAEARWFSRDEALPEVASTISISGHLIRSHFTSLR
ncbi:MAG TPA: NAD(+) diphosphatase [Rhodocyclaceae bacterium]|nr:NAD(+) diphosphatase [Rhodocyclaceae bacterium]